MMPFHKQPGNGNLSREEFGAHTGLDFLFKDPLFDHFDTDHDGVLSKDEFVEKPFAEMNQNGMLQETTSTICNIETCICTFLSQPVPFIISMLHMFTNTCLWFKQRFSIISS